MSNSYKIPPTTAEKQKEINKLSNLEKFALNGYLTSEAPASEKLIIAYEISRPRDSQANRQSIYMQARKWINTNKVRYYLEQRQKELFTPEREKTTGVEPEQKPENTPQISKRTKGETIEELNELADNTSDAKLKAELLIKISDLEGWKKEQEKTDDNTIRYYLPQRCYNCELYKRAKQEKNKTPV